MSLYVNEISWSIDRKTHLLALVSNEFRKWVCDLEEEAKVSYSSRDLQRMVHKEDVHMFIEHMNILYSGQISNLEYRIQLATGETRWVHSIGVPVRDRDNNVIRFDGFVKDVTEKKLMQEQCQRMRLMYEKVLGKIDVAIWSYDTASKIVSFISDGITKITGYPWDKVILPSFLLEFIYKEDLPLLENMKATVRQGLPALSEFRIIHVSGDIRWIQVRIIPSLDDANNVVRLDGAVIDITDRKATEEALLRSEQRYKSLFEYNSDVVCELDIHGNVLAVNSAAGEITREELHLDKECFSITDYFGEEQSERLSNYYQKTLRGYAPYYSITSYHRNDRVIHWEMKNVPIYVNQRIEGVFVIAKDVTDLKGSETRYQRLIELSPQSIVIHREGKMLYLNPSGMALIGAAKATEWIGGSIFDYIHSDYRDEAIARAEQLIHRKYIGSAKYKINRLDGRTIDTEIVGIHDDMTNTTLLFIQDITERLQMERALQKSEERYRRLVELSPEAIATYKNHQFTYINPAGAEMLGVEFTGEPLELSIMDVIHPNYHEHARRRIDNTIRNGYSLPTEYEIVRTDGRVIVVSMLSIFDAQSSSLQLMFDDITEKKQVEQALQESEERYFRLQTSLDQFSRDLFGVMKTSHMKQRLLTEVQNILSIPSATIAEAEHNHDKLCEIIEHDDGFSLKIGEVRGKSYLLCIPGRPPAMRITAIRVWLMTITRYVSVLFDNFLWIEDLTKELEQAVSGQIAPTWLLRFMFNLSEKERKRLAQDLHDSALQEQIVWLRKLELLLSDSSVTGEARKQLEQISEGLLDVIYQLRVTCNELRPPLLIRDGLVPSLEALFEFTQMRANYRVQFETDHFRHKLHDDILIGIYRIVQELLANAAKHSFATEVSILLSGEGERIRLEYKDNGIGMDMARMEDSHASMGIYGMKERVRSMGGTIQFYSARNEGLSIYISVPGCN